VVSTNLAESSVTIDNIVFVVDSCFNKIKYYDYISNCDELMVVPVSQQSAKQRAGRAGRVKGKDHFIVMISGHLFPFMH